MVAMTSVLSKSMPCLVAVECSATAEHCFSSLVYYVFCNPDGDVMAGLVNVRLATGTWEM
jgi:hypothetical protein